MTHIFVGSLVQVRVSRIFGAKPLSEPLNAGFLFNLIAPTWINFRENSIKIKVFSRRIRLTYPQLRVQALLIEVEIDLSVV